MKSWVFYLVLCCPFLFAAVAWSQTDCSDFNTTPGPFVYGSVGTYQHVSGSHQFAHVAKGSCSYSGTASYTSAVGCGLTAQASSSSGESDAGTLNVLGAHYGTYRDAQGITSSGNGAGASADSEGAAAFERCLVSGCGVSISITGSGNGGGFNVGFSPTPLWDDKRHYLNNCPGYTLPQLVCSEGPQPPPLSPGSGLQCWWIWDGANCRWIAQCKVSTPIIVDTTGKGFHFTDPQTACVTFNLSGSPQCYSWPEPGSGNAWLVYDRDRAGQIDSGQELFGNFTPHSDGGIPDRKDANGFLALAWYDQPAQGGNMDLMIDRRDRIWPHLKLWIDQHCYRTPDLPCSALREELYSLDSKGIHSLSLVYGVSPKTDAWGNQFKFSAVVNPEAHDIPLNAKGEACCDLHQTSKDGRLMYDVYLRQKPN